MAKNGAQQGELWKMPKDIANLPIDHWLKKLLVHFESEGRLTDGGKQLLNEWVLTVVNILGDDREKLNFAFLTEEKKSELRPHLEKMQNRADAIREKIGALLAETNTSTGPSKALAIIKAPDRDTKEVKVAGAKPKKDETIDAEFTVPPDSGKEPEGREDEKSVDEELEITINGKKFNIKYFQVIPLLGEVINALENNANCDLGEVEKLIEKIESIPTAKMQKEDEAGLETACKTIRGHLKKRKRFEASAAEFLAVGGTNTLEAINQKAMTGELEENEIDEISDRIKNLIHGEGLITSQYGLKKEAREKLGEIWERLMEIRTWLQNDLIILENFGKQEPIKQAPILKNYLYDLIEEKNQPEKHAKNKVTGWAYVKGCRKMGLTGISAELVNLIERFLKEENVAVEARAMGMKVQQEILKIQAKKISPTEHAHVLEKLKTALGLNSELGKIMLAMQQILDEGEPTEATEDAEWKLIKGIIHEKVPALAEQYLLAAVTGEIENLDSITEHTALQIMDGFSASQKISAAAAIKNSTDIQAIKRAEARIFDLVKTLKERKKKAAEEALKAEALSVAEGLVNIQRSELFAEFTKMAGANKVVLESLETLDYALNQSSPSGEDAVDNRNTFLKEQITLLVQQALLRLEEMGLGVVSADDPLVEIKKTPQKQKIAVVKILDQGFKEAEMAKALREAKDQENEESRQERIKNAPDPTQATEFIDQLITANATPHPTLDEIEHGLNQTPADPEALALSSELLREMVMELTEKKEKEVNKMNFEEKFDVIKAAISSDVIQALNKKINSLNPEEKKYLAKKRSEIEAEKDAEALRKGAELPSDVEAKALFDHLAQITGEREEDFEALKALADASSAGSPKTKGETLSFAAELANAILSEQGTKAEDLKRLDFGARLAQIKAIALAKQALVKKAVIESLDALTGAFAQAVEQKKKEMEEVLIQSLPALSPSQQEKIKAWPRKKEWAKQMEALIRLASGAQYISGDEKERANIRKTFIKILGVDFTDAICHALGKATQGIDLDKKLGDIENLKGTRSAEIEGAIEEVMGKLDANLQKIMDTAAQSLPSPGLFVEEIEVCLETIRNKIEAFKAVTDNEKQKAHQKLQVLYPLLVERIRCSANEQKTYHFIKKMLEDISILNNLVVIDTDLGDMDRYTQNLEPPERAQRIKMIQWAAESEQSLMRALARVAGGIEPLEGSDEEVKALRQLCTVAMVRDIPNKILGWDENKLNNTSFADKCAAIEKVTDKNKVRQATKQKLEDLNLEKMFSKIVKKLPKDHFAEIEGPLEELWEEVDGSSATPEEKKEIQWLLQEIYEKLPQYSKNNKMDLSKNVQYFLGLKSHPIREIKVRLTFFISNLNRPK